MKIGIIGFGRFGKLITKYLAKDFDVYVYDINKKEEEIKELDAKPDSLKQVCKKDILIPCVPISEFENVLNSIKDKLNPDTLVIDVCSVKEHPIELMKKILPKETQILATHPMFGPDSAPTSLKDQKIILYNVNIKKDKYHQIKEFLKKQGLIIIETTPEKHDKEMARSLVLTHFIGRALIDFKAKPLKIDTEGYKRLLKILETVQNDTWQLFEDMNKYNKYAKETRDNFIKSLERVNERLK